MNNAEAAQYRRTVRFQRAHRVWKMMRASFKPFEDKKYMRYEKVLGAGGFGLVQAWSVLKPNGARDRGIAIKAVTRPNAEASLRQEIRWHKDGETQRFKGATHLIQLVDLDDKVMNSSDINNENGNAGVPIMIMEEMGGGSARDLLDRSILFRRANPRLELDIRGLEYIPNRLIRSCIGMNYAKLKGRQGAQITETLGPYRPAYSGNKLVHNDIDVQNIFISDPVKNDEEHSLVPICKIGDYGCMVEWDDSWDKETKKSSIRGKRSHMAPEQFIRELTYIDGALGWHTNVYQIGSAMHDLITQRSYAFRDRSVQRRRKNSTAMGSEYDTYGWRLLEHGEYVIEEEFVKVDIQLRELVAACMAYRASQRPNLSFLETVTMHHIRRLAKQASASMQLDFHDPDDSYKTRVPMGTVEPPSLVERFTDEYFRTPWGDGDPHRDFWAGRIVTPSLQ
ncbi:kinase-like protein [Xylaria intraflava]|nr:kinase-like protein [Xylaria intraflava]